MRKQNHLLGSLVTLALGAIAAQAQTFTNAFPGVTFAKPVWFGEVPGKPETYFVLQQHTGSLLCLRQSGGAWVKDTVWKVSVATSNEMGLLGFAFHPQFATNRKYYVNYNPASGGSATVVEERQVDTSFRKDAGASASRTLLRITQPYSNHNGGNLAFGPKDGFLYLGMGDGGSQNDPEGNGQNKNVLLAKMLRIDVDRKAEGKEYAIPADNPFASGGGAPEVFAWGLRNPWRFSFDPVTGDLWVGDVGQGAQEEVDIVVRNGNYGWDIAEGYANNGAGVTPPVFAYPRGDGTSVTGGLVFRGAPSSKYYGQFIVGDYTTRNLWALKSNGTAERATVEVLADLPAQPSTFGTDSRGHLYVAGHDNGIIYRFDGPDWQPGTTGMGSRPAIGRAIGCIFACQPGGRLDARAFAGGQELAVFSMAGEKVGKLTAGSALPEIRPGMYLLKAPGAVKPDLLLVR